LHGRVAGAVGRDPLREVGAAGGLQALAREALDQLHAAARLQEANRADLALHERGEQVRRLAQRRRAAAELLVHERRVPHRDLALGARSAVAVDQLDVDPGEPLGELGGVRDRRAREEEARLAAVSARKPAQPAQDVGHVRAEHAAVDVRLVHDDPREVGEDVAPRAVVRKHAHVQHVGVREDQVRALADGAALLARRVAVVDRLAEVLPADASEASRLVLRQRLRRIQIEGARGHVARQRVQHGQVEGERLAARGSSRDDRVAAAGGLERIGLVRPQRLDSGRGEPLAQGRVEVVRNRLRETGLLALSGRRDQLLVAARIEHGLPRVGGLRAAHGCDSTRG
jgi:hypothetical protein